MLNIFRKPYLLKNCRYFSRKFPRLPRNDSLSAKLIRSKRQTKSEKFKEPEKPTMSQEIPLTEWLIEISSHEFKASQQKVWWREKGWFPICIFMCVLLFWWKSYWKYLKYSISKLDNILQDQFFMPLLYGISYNFIPADRPKERFKDVIGLDDIIEELEMLIGYYKNTEKYKEAHFKMPKGIFLTGETGTGKTLLANAIAGEAGVTYFKLAASEFDEILAGTGSKKMRELFKRAKRMSPSIIFIDELSTIAEEGVGEPRSYIGESKQTVVQLLHEMEQFDNGEILVIGASNSSEAFDKRLTRNGRFDWKIQIPVPDRKTRKKIEKQTLKTSFSHNNLYNSNGNLQENQRISKLKPVKKDAKIYPNASKEEKLHLAVHQIGIALMYLKYYENSSMKDISFSLDPSKTNVDEFFDVNDRTTRKEILNQVEILISGKAALDLIYERDKRSYEIYEEGTEKTTNYLYKYVSSGLFNKKGLFNKDGHILFYYPDDKRGDKKSVDAETNNILKISHKKSLNYLKNNRPLLMKLSEILAKKENMTAKEIKEIISKAR